MGKKRKSVHLDGMGIPCPRCNVRGQLRYHKEITPKLLKQPFYYSQWYFCMNATCKTTMYVLEEDKVYPQTVQEDEQQNHLFGIMNESN